MWFWPYRNDRNYLKHPIFIFPPFSLHFRPGCPGRILLKIGCGFPWAKTHTTWNRGTFWCPLGISKGQLCGLQKLTTSCKNPFIFFCGCRKWSPEWLNKTCQMPERWTWTSSRGASLNCSPWWGNPPVLEPPHGHYTYCKQLSWTAASASPGSRGELHSQPAAESGSVF